MSWTICRIPGPIPYRKLSFLTYGWSAHEIVYKRRAGKSKDPRLNSKYSDGPIGWRKPDRAQETLWEWVYDDEDNLSE